MLDLAEKLSGYQYNQTLLILDKTKNNQKRSSNDQKETEKY